MPLNLPKIEALDLRPVRPYVGAGGEWDMEWDFPKLPENLRRFISGGKWEPALFVGVSWKLPFGPPAFLVKRGNVGPWVSIISIPDKPNPMRPWR